MRKHSKQTNPEITGMLERVNNLDKPPEPEAEGPVPQAVVAQAVVPEPVPQPLPDPEKAEMAEVIHLLARAVIGFATYNESVLTDEQRSLLRERLVRARPWMREEPS